MLTNTKMFLFKKYIIDNIIQYSKIEILDTSGPSDTFLIQEVEFVVEKAKEFFLNMTEEINEDFFYEQNLLIEQIKKKFDILIYNSDKGLAKVFDMAFDDVQHDLKSVLKVNIFYRLK